MGLLKFANKDEVVRYSSEDGDDWIDLRSTLTKGEMNSLFNSMPDSIVQQAMVEDDDKEQLGAVFIVRDAPQLSIALFEAYAKAWSLDEPCTVASYLDLSPEAASWVDEQVMEHSQNADKRMTSAEGKPQPRSPRGSRKATPATDS